MKSTILILALFITSFSYSQNIILDYYPEYNGLVSNDEYKKGKNILSNAYRQIKEGNNNIIYVDYWNVAVAFSYMGADKVKIMAYLVKSKRMNHDDFCKYVNYQISHVGLTETPLYKALGESYIDMISDCAGIEIKRYTLEYLNEKKLKMDLDGLNEKLIDRLIICFIKDNRYRYSHEEYEKNKLKQDAFDIENELELTKIFDEYGYPGKNLVGVEFMNFSCMILEHGGDLDLKEKYLPLVVYAFQNGQMDKPYLTMLIDRIHWRKTGKQIFGSHSGVPFDTDEVISEIKKKHKL